MTMGKPANARNQIFVHRDGWCSGQKCRKPVSRCGHLQCHITRSVTAVDSSFGLFTCPYLAVNVMCLCACARGWLRFKMSGVSTLLDVQQKVAVVSLSSSSLNSPSSLSSNSRIAIYSEPKEQYFLPELCFHPEGPACSVWA